MTQCCKHIFHNQREMNDCKYSTCFVVIEFLVSVISFADSLSVPTKQISGPYLQEMSSCITILRHGYMRQFHHSFYGMKFLILSRQHTSNGLFAFHLMTDTVSRRSKRRYKLHYCLQRTDNIVTMYTMTSYGFTNGFTNLFKNHGHCFNRRSYNTYYVLYTPVSS